MAVGYTTRTTGWSTRLMIAAGLLALLLVAATPVALFVGVIMMLFGHIIAGLALFGASILAAAVAVTIVALNGYRHLRKMLRPGGPGDPVRPQVRRVIQLHHGDYYAD